MKVTLHRAAIREFEAAIRRYQGENPSAAVRFRNAVDATVESILDHPLTFPTVAPGIRRALCPRFPYAIVFCLFPETIYILAVAHGKRKPQYWRKRVPSDPIDI